MTVSIGNVVAIVDYLLDTLNLVGERNQAIKHGQVCIDHKTLTRAQQIALFTCRARPMQTALTLVRNVFRIRSVSVGHSDLHEQQQRQMGVNQDKDRESKDKQRDANTEQNVDSLIASPTGHLALPAPKRLPPPLPRNVAHTLQQQTQQAQQQQQTQISDLSSPSSPSHAVVEQPTLTVLAFVIMLFVALCFGPCVVCSLSFVLCAAV